MSLSVKSLESMLDDETNRTDKCLARVGIVTPLQKFVRAFLLRHRKFSLRLHPICPSCVPELARIKFVLHQSYRQLLVHSWSFL